MNIKGMLFALGYGLILLCSGLIWGHYDRKRKSPID
jgi:hypothetical protein